MRKQKQKHISTIRAETPSTYSNCPHIIKGVFMQKTSFGDYMVVIGLFGFNVSGVFSSIGLISNIRGKMMPIFLL
jgi:hypothetical protein